MDDIVESTHAPERWVPFVFAWAGIALGIAVPSAFHSTADSRGFVVAISLGLPAAAILAGVLLSARRVAAAVALLALSIAVPTYFLWPVNLVPLLLIAFVLRDAHRIGRSALPA